MTGVCVKAMCLPWQYPAFPSGSASSVRSVCVLRAGLAHGHTKPGRVGDGPSWKMLWWLCRDTQHCQGVADTRSQKHRRLQLQNWSFYALSGAIFCFLQYDLKPSSFPNPKIAVLGSNKHASFSLILGFRVTIPLCGCWRKGQTTHVAASWLSRILVKLPSPFSVIKEAA